MYLGVVSYFFGIKGAIKKLFCCDKCVFNILFFGLPTHICTLGCQTLIKFPFPDNYLVSQFNPPCMGYALDSFLVDPNIASAGDLKEGKPVLASWHQPELVCVMEARALINTGIQIDLFDDLYVTSV